MLKNQHLLGMIAILGFGSAVTCLLLLFSERTNSTGLSRLSGELHDSQQVNRTKTDAHFDKISKQLEDLQQRQDELQKAHDVLAGQFRKTKEDLTETKELLKSLIDKKWLTHTSDDEGPWIEEMKKLDTRLKQAESRLKKLSESPKDEQGQLSGKP